MLPFFNSGKKSRQKKLSRVRFIASDLDGTLLNDGNEISLRSMEIITRLRARGIEFILLSGRSDGFVRKYSRLIKSDAPIVSLNGHLILSPDGNFLHGSFLHEEICSTVCDTAGKHKEVTIAAFTADGILYETPTIALPRYLRPIAEEQKQVTSIASYFGKTALYVCTGSYAAIQDIVRTVAKKYGDALARVSYQTAMGTDRYYLELRNSGISKATALRFLAKHFHTKEESFAAIGDFDNDIEMCRLAGVSAATRNAVDALKADVDIVTRSTNNEDGASEFFQLIYDAQFHD